MESILYVYSANPKGITSKMDYATTKTSLVRSIMMKEIVKVVLQLTI
jgi:hypothetical protein